MNKFKLAGKVASAAQAIDESTLSPLEREKLREKRRAEAAAEGEPDTFRRDFTGDEFPSVCSVTRGHPPVWKDRERSAEEVRSRTQPKSGL